MEHKETIGKIITDNPTTDVIYVDDVIDHETKRYWDHVLAYVDIGKPKLSK